MVAPALPPRKGGRPPDLRRRLRLALADAAPEALDTLMKGVRLGDPQAAGELLRLALLLSPGREGGNG